MNRARNMNPMGNNNNGKNVGNGNNGEALVGDLMEKIRALSLVLAELELYLDTHPKCKTALDYYYQTVEALDKLTEEYNNMGGPLVARDSTNTERWTWVDTPWPWHNGEISAVPKCMREGK